MWSAYVVVVIWPSKRTQTNTFGPLVLNFSFLFLRLQDFRVFSFELTGDRSQ